MVNIISEERFLSQIRRALEKYVLLQEGDPEDKKFKKIGYKIRGLKKLYKKDKVYAVKQLNYFEKSQILFTEEKRALVVFLIEVLQKLILHKKLQKPISTPKFKKKV